MHCFILQREDFQEGEVVEALWDDGHYYEAKIIKTLKNGKNTDQSRFRSDTSFYPDFDFGKLNPI